MPNCALDLRNVSAGAPKRPDRSHHRRASRPRRQRTGDGALVEFRSVVDAVRCAVEIQNGMVERNAGVPAERRIEFRIGIHLGDVVEESDGDLMGDGVNIAARLEGIAQPGTICLSEDAYRQVRARLDLEVNDLCQTRLKNIVEPVRVYSLQVGLPAQAKAASAVESATEEKPVPRLDLPDKPSIAVLAFQNMSGDPEQEYFADGMVEDIITALSRALAVRDRAQFQLHLQGQSGRHQTGRAGTRRPLRP
jgi:adenylate cyclase